MILTIVVAPVGGQKVFQGFLHFGSIYPIIFLCSVQSNNVVMLVIHGQRFVSVYALMFPPVLLAAKVVDSHPPDLAAHNVVVAQAQVLGSIDRGVYIAGFGHWDRKREGELKGQGYQRW
jgi:hypothetical protein